MKEPSIDFFNHFMGLLLSGHVDKAVFRQDQHVNDHTVSLKDGPYLTGMDRVGNVIHKHGVEIHSRHIILSGEGFLQIFVSTATKNISSGSSHCALTL